MSFIDNESDFENFQKMIKHVTHLKFYIIHIIHNIFTKYRTTKWKIHIHEKTI